jgi:hypothetical protein
MHERGPRTHEPLSILQWMAPDLCRAGLIANEDWIPAHAQRACKLYPNQGVHVAATLAAAISPRSIEYLEQAPILAILIGQGSSARAKREREYIARQFGGLINSGPKLKVVLGAYAMPLVARKFAPLVVRPGLYKIIKKLGRKIDPSTLSQIIPDEPAKQALWLDRLNRWDAQLTSRQRNSEALFSWAAFAISRMDLGRDDAEAVGIEDVADFLSEPGRFANPRWTWEKAKQESDLWHDQIANMEISGPNIDVEADYGFWPDEIEIDEFTFVALRSGRQLMLEGRRMKHCVGSYIRDVMKGFSRIYSVRIEAKRVATVQFSEQRLAQAKGPCNRPVSKAVGEAIGKFISEIRKRRPA